MKKSTFLYEFSNNKNLIILHLITFKIAVLYGEDRKHWNDNIYKLSPNKKKFLVSEKFLVEDDDDTKLKNEAIKVLSIKENEERTEFDIYLTNKCNYRCTYCFQGDAKNKSYNKLSKTGIDNIFNSIAIIMSEKRDSYDSPIITLFGGEPLLPTNRDNLYYIFQKCEEKKYKISIVTNGFYITYYKDLIKQYNYLITSFVLTFVGGPKRHEIYQLNTNQNNIFEKLIKNIQYLKNEYPEILVQYNYLVNEKNGNEDFLELYKYLSENKLLDKKHYINPGRIMFRTQEYYKQFYQDELNENKYFETMYTLFQKTGYKNCLSGGEYNVLFKLYELFFEKRSFLPNMKKCSATTGGRYIYYPDSHIYTCTEIAGDKSKAIGKYNPNYVLNSLNVLNWTKENTKLEGKCYTCKYMFICTGGCKVSPEKCPNIKGALDGFFDVIGECL